MYVKSDAGDGDVVPAAAAGGPAAGQHEEVFQTDATRVGSGSGAGGAGSGSGSGGVLRYYFHIGSVDSFERKLDEAQRELGIPPQAMLSVK